MNLEPTAKEAAELLAAAVMGLNDPEDLEFPPQIFQIFPADSSKLCKKWPKMNEDEVSKSNFGGEGYHPSCV